MEGLTLTVRNMWGQVVATPLQKVGYGAGFHEIACATAEWPEGVNQVELRTTDGTILYLRLIK